jgi:uncharacterized protein
MLTRNLQAKIRTRLTQFPIIALLGARQTGKTTLSKLVAPDWKYVDMEDADDYEYLSRDLKFFFKQHSTHVIFDEAQEYPELFRTLRGVVDQQREKKGRFIITGSSSPELLSAISESLAGRIAIINVGTLKANEIYKKPLSPFYQLFESKIAKQNLPTTPPPLSIQEIQSAWFSGGYPEPVLEDKDTYLAWMDYYRDTYVNRDIARLFPKLNRTAYRRFFQMLCQLSGTILNKRDIGRAIEVNEKTVSEYIDIAAGTYIWRRLPSYEKNIEKSVIKMPKGYLRDAGLTHHMLRLYDFDELLYHPSVSRSFEAFVVEEICKGIESTNTTNWQPFYYRTKNKAEIDLIIDGTFGVLPIEIKQGIKVQKRDLITMTRFIAEQRLDFGLVINQSTEPKWLTEHIYQLPAGWL